MLLLLIIIHWLMLKHVFLVTLNCMLDYQTGFGGMIFSLSLPDKISASGLHMQQLYEIQNMLERGNF